MSNHESSRHFIVSDGHYEFLKVPFGLCNSPAVFQRYINAIFRELINDKVVFAYMDDLIIPSEDLQSRLNKLKKVLKVASEVGLSINWRKCKFLGHVIENGYVFPTERKTKAVRDFPEPCTVRQVQSFLGLSGYFRKFIPKYSEIARPLTNLLRKNVEFEEERRRKSSV